MMYEQEILEMFNELRKNVKSEYIKSRYWFVVNDLKIREHENYQNDGIYPTLYREIPLNYERKLRSKIFDDNGVLLYKYNNNLYYNPIQIAQYGLEEYGFYKTTGSETHKDRMDASVNWLKDNQMSDGTWRLNFDFKHPGVSEPIKSPWISALAQGQAISLFCRNYLLTKDDSNINIAESGYSVFQKSVEQGGLSAKTMLGGIWLEEYPTTPPSFTLNGFLYTMFGIYDLFCITGKIEYSKLFDQCIESVVEMLPFYDDSKGFSHYDLCNLTAPVQRPRTNSKYHVLHVILLQYINSIRPNSTFEFYINKWREF